MTLEFRESDHSYRIDGRRVPSVTGIIGQVMPLPFQAGEWHMRRGVSTHHGCRLLDAGTLDWSSVDPEIMPRIKAWEKFRREWPAEIVACELPLGSESLRYAGTLDRVFKREDTLTICDIKSSLSPQVIVQLAAYALLWRDAGNRPVSKGVAVELRSDASYRCMWVDAGQLRRGEQVFLAALTIHNWKKENF